MKIFEEKERICALESCKEKFVSNRWNQKYCSNNCCRQGHMEKLRQGRNSMTEKQKKELREKGKLNYRRKAREILKIYGTKCMCCGFKGTDIKSGKMGHLSIHALDNSPIRGFNLIIDEVKANPTAYVLLCRACLRTFWWAEKTIGLDGYEIFKIQEERKEITKQKYFEERNMRNGE